MKLTKWSDITLLKKECRMILLSIIVLKDKCIEFTDIVNIVNLQEDVTCPKNIRRLLCNFYNIKEEQLVLEDYSPLPTPLYICGLMITIQRCHLVIEK